MKTTTKIAFLTAAVLSACSPSLTLMSRTTGEVGTGSVENATFGNSGSLTINFANETYVGQWTAVQNPGSYSFGLINTSNYGAGGGFGQYTGWAASDSGFGTALLRSNKGSSMRCEFNYNSMTMTAIGVCQKNGSNELFDLQAA